MAYQNSPYQNGQSLLGLTPAQLDNLSNGLKRGGFGFLVMGVANINANSRYGRQKVTIKTEMRGQSPHLVVEIPGFINNFNGALQRYNLLSPNEQNQNKSVAVTLHVVDAKANDMCQLAYQGYLRAGVQFLFVGYDKPEQTSRGNTRHIIHCFMLCVSRWSMKPDAAVLEIDDQRNTQQNNIGAPVPNGGYTAPGGQYNSNGGYYNAGAPAPGGNYGGAPAPAPAQNGYGGNAGAPASGGNYGGAPAPAPAQNGYGGNAGAPAPGGNTGAPAPAPQQSSYPGRDPIVGPTSEEMSAVLDDEGDLPF